MLTSQQIRQQYMDFFESKQHQIVSSSPMVVKNDPTLMFTNAGMNQFKDIFLGNRTSAATRIANTQKCLRVSGKHNDLEEVGHDTYHHTMFEMLGNWSFGDYFKKDAINWAWELLTGVYKMDPARLYATVFEGDSEDGLEEDGEAKELWRQWMPDNHILNGSKKDNFWEMGDSGPCGPCSEIHVDLRSDAERSNLSGADLVNTGHPLVVEIWNLVFIQFNRLSDSTLVPLPNRHVDTGMGFERLCMALQGKTSNYDTDVFQPVIHQIGIQAGKQYGNNHKDDIAFRVIADHLRAVAFSIADGQLPSNVKAGYVIRRILRRAIRYGYTYLGFREPFIHKLVPVLAEQMGGVFPELVAQQTLITKVIAEEEGSFLRTLETGIHLLEQMTTKLHAEDQTVLDGKTAFLLYDTYGFPFDLTALILAEQNMEADQQGFLAEMEAQKNRSRNAAKVDTDDWVVVNDGLEDLGFIGYDQTEAEASIIKYRKIISRESTRYQLVLNRTPFYAESGGQVGDTGTLLDPDAGEEIRVINTQYENRLIVHLVEQLPSNPSVVFVARVSEDARRATARNHSATHLLHLALREVLGTHVEQKGSLVHPDYFRFDFAHFSKMSSDEIARTELLVNRWIMDATNREEQRNLPIAEAQAMGAMSLFGEKYGDTVRVIRFGDSVELCGGTHVNSTGEIGSFKILSEGAIAAGIRRIEAITGWGARNFYEEQLATVNAMKELLRNPKEPLKSLEQLLEKQKALEDQLATLAKAHAATAMNELLADAEMVNGFRFIGAETTMVTGDIKDLAFKLRETESNLVMALTSTHDQKAGLVVFVSPDLIATHKLNAASIIKSVSQLIQGGGGGQDFFASAGGKNTAGLPQALKHIREMLQQI
jgi:alanyl-tRNA synthetase